MIRSKKSIHINVDPEVHASFRIQCFHRGLSMQEVFATFAERVGIESNDMIRFLDQIANDKKVKAVKRYTKSDTDAIYAMLESEDPFDRSNQEG